MTLEEVLRKYEDDTLNAALVPYVKPLVDRIRQLEQDKKYYIDKYNQVLDDLPYDD